MQQMLMTVLVLVMLSGCAQPSLEQPKANGTYLVIDHNDAWAVVISDGKRVEEHGLVIDVIGMPKQGAAVANSYVIDTPNCGRVQWMAQHDDVAEGATSLMALSYNKQLTASSCVIGEGLSNVWTVLDYSS
ncbi:hypothetical protein ACIGCM_22000 [Pseudomonas sp. NPDC078700]|uniref:hypothetical protein n=1 Tax=Pseudomonas sp. NPDC078700 TaxID=3364424 RepID=UPI0037C8F78B